MWCFDWQRVLTKELGWIHVPVADVEIQAHAGSWKIIRVIVDSGAVVSLFKRSFGELLGLDVEAGLPLAVSGIGHGAVKTYLHDVKLKIAEEIISLPAAFAATDGPPNLLGRHRLFDHLDVLFRHRRKRTCFHAR